MDASTSTTTSLARKRFWAAYGRFPSPLLLISAGGSIISANTAIADMLGRSADQLAGINVHDLMAGSRQDTEQAMRIWSRSSEFLPGALRWRLPDGGDIRTRCEGAAARISEEDDYPVGSMLIRVLPTDAMNARFHTLNDTIDRLAGEIYERRRTEALLAGQNEVLQSIAQDEALETTLTKLVKVIERYAGHTLISSVLLLDNDGIHLRHGAAPSLPDPYRRAIDGLEIGPALGSCGTAAYRRERVIVEDISTDPLWAGYRELALGHGLRACWSTPILDGEGRVLGTFAMYHGEPRRPTAEEERLVALATRTATLAIVHSRSAEALRNVLEQQSSILNALPAAVALLNADKSIVAVNENWSSVMHSGELGDCIGQKYTSDCLQRLSAPPALANEIEAGLLSVLRDGRQYTAEFESSRMPGRWWFVTACPLRRDAGDAPGAVVMHLDISDRKRAEGELLLHAEKLAKANSDLQQFAYIASHDLREPLRTIKSFSQLLQRRHAKHLPLDGRQFLGFITESVDRMDNLLQDLLAFSRAVHESAPERKPVPLDRPCNTALRNLQALIESSQAEISVASLPTAYANEVRAAQVFQNLIGNAIKYTNGRRPRIRVHAQESGRWVTISVADNGVGIPMEYRDTIFGMFKRLHARDVPGTGLGLALCKRIVETHGGRIWVEDARGGGSVFRFTMPSADVAEATA